MIFIAQEEEIKLDQPLQSLYFYTVGMPFYNKLIHVISKLEEQYPQIKIVAVDAEHFSNQCVRFNIVSTPTLVFLKNGREVQRIEGSVKKQDFIDAFHDICIS